MTNKPNDYTVTSEHFARARADIARRRAQLIAALDAELAEIDACESTAAGIAERYPEDAGPAAAKSIAKAKRPNTGRPYKSKENVRIVAAERGELKALAEALDRDYQGVLKQHEVLLKQQRKPEKTDTLVPSGTHRLRYNTGPGTPFQEPQSSQALEMEEPLNSVEQPAPPEKPASENSPIVEATAAPTTAPPADPRQAPFTRNITRGRAVDGIVDNGPGRGRVYDPVAFVRRGRGESYLPPGDGCE